MELDHLVTELRKVDPQLKLLQAVSLQQIAAFFTIAQHLKLRIGLNSTHLQGDTPPSSLSLSIYNFLCDATGLSEPHCHSLWQAVQHHVWHTDPNQAEAEPYIDLFLQHGLRHEIGEKVKGYSLPGASVIQTIPGFYDLYPPTLTCTDTACSTYGQRLKEPVTHQAVYFTKTKGPFPMWTTSLYCRGKQANTPPWFLSMTFH